MNDEDYLPKVEETCLKIFEMLCEEDITLEVQLSSMIILTTKIASAHKLSRSEKKKLVNNFKDSLFGKDE